MGKLVCACSNAYSGCDKVCAKGRVLKPTEVFVVPWRKVVSRDIESAVRLMDLKGMERDD